MCFLCLPESAFCSPLSASLETSFLLLVSGASGSSVGSWKPDSGFHALSECVFCATRKCILQPSQCIIRNQFLLPVSGASSPSVGQWNLILVFMHCQSVFSVLPESAFCSPLSASLETSFCCRSLVLLVPRLVNGT